jgi:hypothetical protein
MNLPAVIAAYAHTEGILLPLAALYRPWYRPPPGDVAAAWARQLADLMEQGVSFPPIIVWIRGDGLFAVVHGNHRCAASLLLGFSHIPCLIEPR